ncbi:coth protein-domain-containing protein [Absidia repens]|uniref:Coth protein-domain-containing protein n=1 Tax=Absidia repens TaxID=90262 RepID=A0A1X2ILN4_9FUNG|nr:coth protein-domain-containing protein [Absidia repens]
MGVIVNGQTYSLQPSKDISVLHSGIAPSGAYSYVKLNQDNVIVEMESFQRQPDQDLETTPNEFYNRTWNTMNMTDLPTLLQPLPSVHRVNSSLHAKNQIPTIYLSGNQSQIELMHSNTTLDTKVTMNMHFIETEKTTSVEDVEVKLAGRSSKWLDKLSYGIKIKKGDNLYGYRRLKLRALRSDPSYVREILCYDMMKSMGLPVSGASYARVIMNDQPLGLFLMIEAYKNDWYKNEFGDGEKLEHGRGITYQGAGMLSDLSYYGDNNVSAYDGPYKIEEDADKKHSDDGETSDFQKLMNFTQFLSGAPTTSNDAATIWNEYIDMDSVIRSFVIEIVGGLSDGYIANANNFFLYDNLAERRFTYLAADFDTTLGNTFVKLEDMWSGNYSQYPGFSMRPLAQKMIQVPEFKAQFEQLLLNTTQRLIDPEFINPRIDDLVKMIRQDVEWDIGLPKMNPNATIDTETAEYFKDPKDLPPPMDWDTIKDIQKRSHVDFDIAVNGPTHSISLPGVKEWFANQSKAIQDYFVQQPPLYS